MEQAVKTSAAAPESTPNKYTTCSFIKILRNDFEIDKQTTVAAKYRSVSY